MSFILLLLLLIIIVSVIVGVIGGLISLYPALGILLIIFAIILALKEQLRRKKQIKNIEFKSFTSDEYKRYNFYKRFVFSVSLFVFMIVSWEFLEFDIKNFLFYIIILLLSFIPYIMFFFGKPQGVKSAKISDVMYKLSYDYNLYFEDVDKEISNMAIWFINHMSLVNSGAIYDEYFRVKVAKSKLGFPFVFLDTKYIDRSNKNLDKATKLYLRKMSICGNIMYGLGFIVLLILLPAAISAFVEKDYHTFGGLGLSTIFICAAVFYLGYKLKHKPEEIIRNWKGEIKK